MKRSPIQRKTGLQRGKPIARRSKKMRLFYEQVRRPQVQRILAAHPLCQLQTPVCTRTATTVHEMLTRGRGGGIRAERVHDDANCLASCAPCNDWVGTHPLAAREMGLLRKATDE